LATRPSVRAVPRVHRLASSKLLHKRLAGVLLPGLTPRCKYTKIPTVKWIVTRLLFLVGGGGERANYPEPNSNRGLAMPKEMSQKKAPAARHAPLASQIASTNSGVRVKKGKAAKDSSKSKR
jgi:hypothetical protein